MSDETTKSINDSIAIMAINNIILSPDECDTKEKYSKTKWESEELEKRKRDNHWYGL